MAKKRAVPPTIAGREFLSGSVEETQALGEAMGRLLKPGDVVALRGELGSGKTTVIQGVARGLGLEASVVKSPTFVLMREYPGDVPLVHIDGYRLEGTPAVSWLDLDLIFSPHKVTVIEWAERFGALLPEDRVELSLAHVSAHRRRVQVHGTGSRSNELLVRLRPAASSQQPAAEEAHEPSDAPTADAPSMETPDAALGN